jgi:hypothetical protein
MQDALQLHMHGSWRRMTSEQGVRGGRGANWRWDNGP